MTTAGRRSVLCRWVAVAALVGASASGLAACGGSDAPAATTTTARPAGSALTAADSARLAQVLYRNYTSGGASVVASFEYSAELNVRLEGVVDWVHHAGRFTVRSTFADGRPQTSQRVVFEEDAVYEQASAEQVAALAGAGHPGVAWLRRSPEPSTRPVDQVIALLVSLAATRPDNPQLLEQGATTFDRTEQVGARTADVYATEKGASYWIARKGGRLLRFEGHLDGFSGPVLMDFTDPGPPKVAVPSGATVADAAELAGS